MPKGTFSALLLSPKVVVESTLPSPLVSRRIEILFSRLCASSTSPSGVSASHRAFLIPSAKSDTVKPRGAIKVAFSGISAMSGCLSGLLSGLGFGTSSMSILIGWGWNGVVINSPAFTSPGSSSIAAPMINRLNIRTRRKWRAGGLWRQIMRKNADRKTERKKIMPRDLAERVPSRPASPAHVGKRLPRQSRLPGCRTGHAGCNIAHAGCALPRVMLSARAGPSSRISPSLVAGVRSRSRV